MSLYCETVYSVLVHVLKSFMGKPQEGRIFCEHASVQMCIEYVRLAETCGMCLHIFVHIPFSGPLNVIYGCRETGELFLNCFS